MRNLVKRLSGRRWLLATLAIPFLFNFDLVFEGKGFFNRALYYGSQCGDIVSDRFSYTPGPGFALSDPESSSIYNEPMAKLAREKLRRGELPLWSNQIGFGSPILASIQPGVLFPLNWIAFAAGDSWGFDLLMFARLVFSFLAMVLALRKGFSFSWPASVGAGIVYGFTGHAMLKANMNSVNVYVVFPLYFWAIHSLHLAKPGRFAVAGTAITSALLIFSGFPEAALGAFYFGLAFHLLWLAKRPGLRAFGRLVLAYGLAALLAAPQLLPLAEVMSLLPRGYRRGVGTDGIDWVTLGRDLVYPVKRAWPHILHPGWAGIMPLALGAGGLALGLIRRSSMVAVMVLLGTLYVLKTVRIPGVSEAILSLPFVEISHPSRDLSLWLFFPLSFGVGTLLDRWPMTTKRMRTSLLVGIVLTGTIWLAWAAREKWIFEGGKLDLLRYLQGQRPVIWTALAWLGLPIGLAAIRWSRSRGGAPALAQTEAHLLFGLLLFQVLFTIPRGKTDRIDLGYQDFAFLREPLHAIVPPEGKLAAAWKGGRCTSHVTAGYGYNSFVSVEPLMPRRFSAFVDSFFECNGIAGCLFGLHGAKTQDRLLPWKLAGARHLLIVNDQEDGYGLREKSSEARRVWKHPGKRIEIFENPGALPKTRLYSSCRILGSAQAVFDEIKTANQVPEMALLDEEDTPIPAEVREFCARPQMSESGPALGRPRKPLAAVRAGSAGIETSTADSEADGDGEPGSVRLKEYSDSRIRIDADVRRDSVLMLSEIVHPSWVARVDGERRPVFPVFGVYRGVLLQPGDRAVAFEYFPWTWYLGVALFGIGAIGAAWSARARPRRAR